MSELVGFIDEQWRSGRPLLPSSSWCGGRASLALVMAGEPRAAPCRALSTRSGVCLLGALPRCGLVDPYGSALRVPALCWIAEAPSLYYWGDIDAEGFEILAGYRRDGLAVTSILMNPDTYETYAAWGTNTLPNGEKIRRRAPKALPDLTAEERDAYHAVCQPSDGLPLRVEQERIPLDVAAARLPVAEEP